MTARLHGFVPLLHFSFGFFDDTMPPKIAEHIQHMRDENPDVTVRVWGPKESRELVASMHDAALLATYDGLEVPIMRSDMSRYAILYRHGGMYADLDYTFNVPLRDIFATLAAQYPSKTSFVNRTPNTVFLRRLSNSLMIAKEPRLPFWLHVLRSVNNGHGLSPHARIMSGSGPQLMDRASASAPRSLRATVQALPTKTFNPCSVCSRGCGCATAPHVMAAHKNAGSWNSATSLTYNFMYCNLWWLVAVVALLLTVIALAVVLGVQRRR